jgi:hypothetical protein
VFGALVLATVIAFFVTQHLKVTTPVIAGQTYGDTPHLIFPGSVPGDPACPTATTVYFFLLHRADRVDVTVIDAHGAVVRTLADGLAMPTHQSRSFTWNLRESDGLKAPTGLYNFRLRLLDQHRTISPLVEGLPEAPTAPVPIHIFPACSAP